MGVNYELWKGRREKSEERGEKIKNKGNCGGLLLKSYVDKGRAVGIISGNVGPQIDADGC